MKHDDDDHDHDVTWRGSGKLRKRLIFSGGKGFDREQFDELAIDIRRIGSFDLYVGLAATSYFN